MIIQRTLCHERKKKNLDEDNWNRPAGGLRINKIKYGKKIDEVQEDDDETIAILTEHHGMQTRLKKNKAFQIL